MISIQMSEAIERTFFFSMHMGIGTMYDTTSSSSLCSPIIIGPPVSRWFRHQVTNMHY